MQDVYCDQVAEFAAYLDKKEKIVGIYATNEDSLVAERSLALKKLKNLYGYKIQMVIK